LLVCGAWLTAAQAQVEYVDPTIGGVGYLLEPTRPTVSLPNSMLRFYPARRDALDDQIHSFPLTIISHRLGELFWLMPCAGEPDAGAWNHRAAYDQEKTTPYYYSTRLDGSLIQVEFTPTARCGYFRFTFPSGKPVVLLANRKDGELAAEGTNAVAGSEQFQGMKAFVYGEFSAPVSVAASRAGAKSRLAIRAREPGKGIEFRYGISYISVEQARKAFEGFSGAAQKAIAAVDTSAIPAAAGAKVVGATALGYAEANVKAAFDLATKLVQAKDVQEVLTLQTEFAKSQFAAFQEQTKELGAAFQEQTKEIGAAFTKAASPK